GVVPSGRLYKTVLDVAFHWRYTQPLARTNASVDEYFGRDLSRTVTGSRTNGEGEDHRYYSGRKPRIKTGHGNDQFRETSGDGREHQGLGCDRPLFQTLASRTGSYHVS